MDRQCSDDFQDSRVPSDFKLIKIILIKIALKSPKLLGLTLMECCVCQ